MRVRTGLVANSSSTAFLIMNTSDEAKTLADFVRENPWLVDAANEFFDGNPMYDEGEPVTLDELVLSAERRNQVFQPARSVVVDYGDMDGDVIGIVLDDLLRDGGHSESFVWQFHHHMR